MKKYSATIVLYCILISLYEIQYEVRIKRALKNYEARRKKISFLKKGVAMSKMFWYVCPVFLLRKVFSKK